MVVQTERAEEEEDEMKPFITDVKIDLNPDYGSVYIYEKKSGEPIMIQSDPFLPFEIVVVPQKVLTKEEKIEKFAMAIHDWINRRL